MKTLRTTAAHAPRRAIYARNDRRYRMAAMAQAGTRPPQKFGLVMQPLLDRLDSGGQFGIVRLAREWPDIVGEAIARRTQVVSLKFHTAVIKVSGAMWIQELNLMKVQILARVKDRIGADTVRELRFIQGRLSRHHGPRLRTVPRAPRHSIEVPEMKNPELRRAFESLIEAWGRASR